MGFLVPSVSRISPFKPALKTAFPSVSLISFKPALQTKVITKPRHLEGMGSTTEPKMHILGSTRATQVENTLVFYLEGLKAPFKLVTKVCDAFRFLWVV